MYIFYINSGNNKICGYEFIDLLSTIIDEVFIDYGMYFKYV